MGILDTAKDVITLVQKADNIELVKQVLALQNDIMKMMEENRELQEQVNSLREQLKTKGSLTYREGYYWLKKDDGTEDGRFCTVCYDTDGKLVRITFRNCQACQIKAASKK